MKLLSPSMPPAVNGRVSLVVNGKSVKSAIADAYAALDRTWTVGDKVGWTVPLKVQCVKADNDIVADRGRGDLCCGPLIYNLERRDQNLNAVPGSAAKLAAEWQPDLLGGGMVIQGAATDGLLLVAITNYSQLCPA